MASGQLTTVMRHIHKLAGAPHSAETTDAQLLERFVSRREEAAFAMLVQRYGPMVLGVCRRVLHNLQDAEDAFQASFLILVRKAASITKGAALGAWLHEVALRTALRAGANRASRRTHERQVVTLQPTDFVAALAWRDLAPVLDEEVLRLPEKYRVPFVLCYLEGQTYDKAARQLSCPTGTISCRLARARKLLQARLTRRGLALPAGVLAMVLSENAASAVMPGLLAASTVRAALLSAAGKAASAVISPHVAALTEGGINAMRMTTFHKILALVVTLGLIGAGASFLARPAPAEQTRPASKQGQTKPAPKAKTNAKAPRALPAKDKPAAQDTMTVTGHILSADGKPLPQAVVAVVGRAKSPDRIHQHTSWPKTLGQGKTGADGRFRLLVPRTSKERYWEVYVLAGSPGHGLGTRHLDADAVRPDVKLQLPRQDVLRVRLVDLQGKPAAGVKVRVVTARGNSAAQNYFWLHFADPPENLPVWPKPPNSDNQGRFTLTGLGPDLTVTLQTQSNHTARHELEIKPADRQGRKEVTLALAPARILEGAVTFADTRKPIPHARLLVHARKSMYDFGRWAEPLECQADAQGRFRVIPSAGNHFTVIAYPPDETPYLLLRKEIAWPKADVVKQQVNLALPRGILVRGTITEKPSGKPVRGATIDYEPLQGNNPFYRGDIRPFHDGWGLVHLSGSDGKFHIPILPGPGHLLIKGPTPDYLRVEIRNKKLYGVAILPDSRNYLDGLVALNVKPQPGPHEVKVTLTRGVTLKGNVLGPDGKPVARAVLFSRVYIPHGRTLNPVNTKDVKDGRFELPGCDPDKMAQVFFFDVKNKLGAVVDLSGQNAKGKPVTVGLHPCGTATARFVDKDGKPVAGVRPMLEVVVTRGIPFVNASFDSKEPGADTAYMANLDREGHGNLRSDAQGRVVFPSLIPGATYWMIGQSPNRGLYNLNKEFKAETGKTLNLGDIRVKTAE